MKVFPETMKPKFLRDGVTLSGSSLRALVRPRSELRFCNLFFGGGFQVLQGGVTLLGSRLRTSFGLDLSKGCVLILAYGGILQSLLHCPMLGRVCYI